jgi:hypothetical protein
MVRNIKTFKLCMLTLKCRWSSVYTLSWWTTDKLYEYWVGFELTTLVVIGTDCIGNKSNYHAITTMTVPSYFIKKTFTSPYSCDRVVFKIKNVSYLGKDKYGCHMFWSCLFFVFNDLRWESKDWLAWNRDNVSKWGDMSICRLLFQWPSTMKTQQMI